MNGPGIRDGIYAALFASGAFYLFFFGAILLLIVLKFMGEHCVSVGVGSPHSDIMEQHRRDSAHNIRCVRKTNYFVPPGGKKPSTGLRGSVQTGSTTPSGTSFQLGAMRIR